MLSPDRLAVKASEAIQLAAQEARREQHPQIDGVHLLQALLDQEDGIVAPILNKLGVTVSLIRERTRESLGTRSRVSGGADPGISRDLTRALDVAEEEARGLGDEYVSTEHLLLGLSEEKGDAGKILRGQPEAEVAGVPLGPTSEPEIPGDAPHGVHELLQPLHLRASMILRSYASITGSQASSGGTPCPWQ